MASPLGPAVAVAALAAVSSSSKKPNPDTLRGVMLGGLGFIAISYVVHCKYNWGPWPCQRDDACHTGNT